MSRTSSIGQHPNNIQDALLERILLRNCTQQALVDWLLEQFAVSVSKSAINRYALAVHKQYGGLIELGMPVSFLVRNRHKLHTIGLENIQQKLLARAEKYVDTLIEAISDTSTTRSEPKP